MYQTGIRHVQVHPLNLDRPKRIRAFLGQDKYWVNAQLEQVRIKDMDAEYLLATMIWLLKRAPEVYLVLDLDSILNAGTDPIEVANVSLATSPDNIQSTPLFLKLRERYLKLVK